MLRHSIQYRREVNLLLFIIPGLIFLTVIISIYLPMGIDWRESYRPAARLLLLGRSPYEVPLFPNPPWALLPLIPFALLPENLGRAALLLASLIVYGYVAYRLGAKPIALAAFLLSPPVMHGLLNANIDWLALLGFILPPQIGLFFVSIKPQVGIGVAIFWFVEAWRKGGWREIVRVFWPVSVVLILSLVLYGFWPLRFGEKPDLWWNASLWPISIPVGLALLVASLRKRKIEYAMGAAPCLSPYVLLHSWVGALVSIVSMQAETIIAVVGLWIVVILQSM